jgi:hypothetical protein
VDLGPALAGGGGDEAGPAEGAPEPHAAEDPDGASASAAAGAPEGIDEGSGPQAIEPAGAPEAIEPAGAPEGIELAGAPEGIDEGSGPQVPDGPTGAAASALQGLQGPGEAEGDTPPASSEGGDSSGQAPADAEPEAV